MYILVAFPVTVFDLAFSRVIRSLALEFVIYAWKCSSIKYALNKY